MERMTVEMDPKDYKYRVTLISNEKHTIDTFLTNYCYSEIFKVAYEDAKKAEFMLFVIEDANDPNVLPIFAASPMNVSAAFIYDPVSDMNTYQSGWNFGEDPLISQVHHVIIEHDCADDHTYLLMQRDWYTLKEECQKASYGFVRIADLFEEFKRFVNAARRMVGKAAQYK